MLSLAVTNFQPSFAASDILSIISGGFTISSGNAITHFTLYVFKKTPILEHKFDIYAKLNNNTIKIGYW